MHRLVAQQIAKATDAAGAVDVDRLAELVSNAYEEHDRDRRRTARSMSLMIEEIDAINRNLEQTVVERTQELRAREADLQAQNMRFNAAVSNMSQGLVMFDAGQRLVICNQRYIDMYGLDADAVAPGCTLRELIELRIASGTYSGDPGRYIAKLSAAIAAGQDDSASSSSSRTDAPSRWSVSRWTAAAGSRPTRTSPSGGARK